ncbi:uncharacterized protein B0T23DRAFT_429150 [Neurospora hispaniola]|uniref:Uncharacterized protein n=1 Tax=Neurospora hispaniola TaxID=588809 RepID=A0AAJ0I8J9_9PEZI|nr:hypothetical protein B0T23DRAFT_429150 [Neurospora hispaniola]
MRVTRRGPGLKRPAKSRTAYSSSLRGAAGGRSDQDHYWLHLASPWDRVPTPSVYAPLYGASRDHN